MREPFAGGDKGLVALVGLLGELASRQHLGVPRSLHSSSFGDPGTIALAGWASPVDGR